MLDSSAQGAGGQFTASPRPVVAPFSPSAPAPDEFELAWGSTEELLASDPAEVLPMDPLLEGWMEREDVVMWSGDPGVGKSVMLLATGLCLSAGTRILNYWPHPTGEPMRVVYLDLENRRPVIQRRVIRIAEGLGLDYRRLARGPFFPCFLRGTPVLAQGYFARTLARLRAIDPDLIIIDTLFSATDQPDLSPTEGVRFFRNVVFRLQRELIKPDGRLPGIWLVHHNRKPATDAPPARIGDQHQSSGGGFVNLTDALVLVQSDETGRVILTNPKQRHTRNSDRYIMTLQDGGAEGPLGISIAKEGAPGQVPVGNNESQERLLAELYREIHEHPTTVCDGLPAIAFKRAEEIAVATLQIVPRAARSRLTTLVNRGRLRAVKTARADGELRTAFFTGPPPAASGSESTP